LTTWCRPEDPVLAWPDEAVVLTLSVELVDRDGATLVLAGLAVVDAEVAASGDVAVRTARPERGAPSPSKIDAAVDGV
jgi:hypothetical protein